MNRIFEPLTVKGHEIKNRIVIPPMVTFGYGTEKGFVSDELVKHYKDRAEGGPGMIWVEASSVTENGRLRLPQIGLWKDEHIEGHKKIVDAIHSCGIPCIAQLHHAGIEACGEESNDPIGPTAFEGELRGRPRKARAISVTEIKEIEERFLQAAERAVKAGHDGIELHCAHSYLLASFMSPVSNKRQDEYGGSLENRLRFPLEILQEIVRRYPDKIISVRMGCETDEAVDMAKAFIEAGADIINSSTAFGTGGYMPEENMEKAPEGFGFNIRIYGASRIKKETDCIVLGTGSIRQAHQAEAVLEKGCCDLVGIGRGQLVDPRFVAKIKTGEQIIECFNCKKCIWSTDLHKCPGRSKYLNSIKS